MKYQVNITRKYSWFKEIEADNLDQLEEIIFEMNFDECLADFETDYEIIGD